MLCKNCGYTLNDNQSTCSNCGYTLDADQNICSNSGQKNKKKTWGIPETLLCIFCVIFLLYLFAVCSINSSSNNDSSQISKSTTPPVTSSKPISPPETKNESPKPTSTNTSYSIQYYSDSLNVPDFGHMFGIEATSYDATTSNGIGFGVVNYAQGKPYIQQYKTYLTKNGFFYMGETYSEELGVMSHAYCNDLVYILVLEDNNMAAIQWTDLPSIQKKYPGYSEHPSVPDFGKVFGNIPRDLFKKDGDITTYGYFVDITTENSYLTRYINILIQAGFVMQTDKEKITNGVYTTFFERGTRLVQITASSAGMIVGVRPLYE